MSEPDDLADSIVVNELLAILIRRYGARLLRASHLAEVQAGVARACAAYAAAGHSGTPRLPDVGGRPPVQPLPIAGGDACAS